MDVGGESVAAVELASVSQRGFKYFGLRLECIHTNCLIWILEMLMQVGTKGFSWLFWREILLLWLCLQCCCRSDHRYCGRPWSLAYGLFFMQPSILWNIASLAVLAAILVRASIAHFKLAYCARPSKVVKLRLLGARCPIGARHRIQMTESVVRSAQVRLAHQRW